MGQSASKSLFDEPKPTWHEVPNSKTATHGAARLVDLPTKYKPYMTLYTNLMERRAVDDGSRRIFGWRTRDEATNTVGDYEWVTYSQFLDHVANVSAAMAHELGLARQEPVGLFCKNRYEWVQVEHAANRMAYQLVPLYDTLGPTAVPFIINQTEMRVLFVAKQQFPTLLRALDQCNSIKIVVQFEPVTEEQKQQAAAKGVELKDWTGLLETAKSKPVDADPPNPEDVATICYTSGTTGDPKGVMLTHANMISAAHGATALEAILLDDVHLSYLPLPHVFERAVQAGTICAGGCVGFYQGDVSKLTDDMAALQPTIFPGVPRVLNRIHDKITQGVEKAGGVKKMLFDRAYAAKKYWLAQGYVTHAFWDAVIFKKVQQLMGGRVRIIMNGSAPIAQDCKEFLQIVFGVPVIEGYGMTENAAVTALSTRAFAPGTHVGMPIPQLEVCLFDVPEMNYTSADSPDPRGEVCVRGPGVFKGYFKDPVKTAETIDAEGWLHTGDIGKWNPDGTLSIIDRKKNIFKLSQGEYVAPEKIENVYLKSTLVAQIFVHGNSLQNYLVGIVIPEKDSVLEWAKKNGHEQDLKALYASEELKKAINADLEELAVKYGLFRFERVHKLHLHDEVWTADNNLATPTFKLKRPQLVEYYANAIEDMYSA